MPENNEDILNNGQNANPEPEKGPEKGPEKEPEKEPNSTQDSPKDTNKDTSDSAAEILNFAEKSSKLISNASTTGLVRDLGVFLADTRLTERGLSALEKIPFGKIIGNPLNAIISAQTDAAKATLKYINEVGLIKGKDNKQQVALVVLEFLKDGKLAEMQIPLLTLVPIPTVVIDTATYTFKIKIDSSAETVLTEGTEDSFSIGYAPTGEKKDNSDPSSKGSTGSKSNSTGGQEGSKANEGGKDKSDKSDKSGESKEGKPSVAHSFNTSLSSKRDSKATRDSKYSIETTMDMTVTAKQGDMPGGIAKMLEILNNSIEVSEADKD